MTDVKRERIAKALLEVVREVWCDRDIDDGPYFNCSKCEFEDGINCRLKLFISNAKYEHEHAHPQGAITVSNESYREDRGEYRLATEQMEHDALYEPTYNPEDGSM